MQVDDPSLAHGDRVELTFGRNKRKRASDVNAMEESSDSESSDWGDWADAMVAQNSTEIPDSVEERKASRRPVDVQDVENGEMDTWAQEMMDQGTDRSVVQGAEKRVWDYVLRMAVEGPDRNTRTLEGATTPPHYQEIIGATPTECVARWLQRNTPHAGAALTSLRLVATANVRGTPREIPVQGKAFVDSFADPSVVAIVSRAAEHTTARVVLYSLSSIAAAALAAAVVQPGASGVSVPHLATHQSETEYGSGHANQRREAMSHDKDNGHREPEGGISQSARNGVIFECLDSRILEGELTAAMARLRLIIHSRSRSGLWVLPKDRDAVLSRFSKTHEVATLAMADAQAVCQALESSGKDQFSEEAVRGLIQRNECFGIRRGNRLVAGCLGFDCGLFGGLYVKEGLAASDAVGSLVMTVLENTKRPGVDRHGVKATRGISSRYFGEGSRGNFGFVLDNEAPFVEIMRDIGLQRYSDADWLLGVSCEGKAGSSSHDPSRAEVVPILSLLLRA